MSLALPTRVGLMMGVREGFMWKARREDYKRLLAWAQHRAEELHRDLVILERGDKIFAKSIPAKDDSSVVLVAYAFEYVQDLGEAWEEVERVAGSASNMFVAHFSKQSLIAWLRPGARYVIDSAPPTTPMLSARKTGHEYPVLVCQDKKRPFCVWGSRPYGSR